jgi:hypothetical protein
VHWHGAPAFSSGGTVEEGETSRPPLSAKPLATALKVHPRAPPGARTYDFPEGRAVPPPCLPACRARLDAHAARWSLDRVVVDVIARDRRPRRLETDPTPTAARPGAIEGWVPEAAAPSPGARVLLLRQMGCPTLADHRKRGLRVPSPGLPSSRVPRSLCPRSRPGWTTSTQCSWQTLASPRVHRDLGRFLLLRRVRSPPARRLTPAQSP